MDKGKRPKIVLDTSVLIAALRSGTGASAEIIRLVLETEIRLILSYSLLSEYQDVALRPNHVAASQLSNVELLEVIDKLEAIAEAVLRDDRHGSISIDPGDDMVLETAINGDADLIVTHNVRHLREPASRFKIEVRTPRKFFERQRSRE